MYVTARAANDVRFARISRTKAWKYPLENKVLRENDPKKVVSERLNTPNTFFNAFEICNTDICTAAREVKINEELGVYATSYGYFSLNKHCHTVQLCVAASKSPNLYFLLQREHGQRWRHLCCKPHISHRRHDPGEWQMLLTGEWAHLAGLLFPVGFQNLTIKYLSWLKKKVTRRLLFKLIPAQLSFLPLPCTWFNVEQSGVFTSNVHKFIIWSETQVGQIQPGLFGMVERALARTQDHIWFERSAIKDRLIVTRRYNTYIR